MSNTKYGFYWHPGYNGTLRDYRSPVWVELVTIHPETGGVMDVITAENIITHDEHGQPVTDPRRHTENILLGQRDRADVLFSKDKA